MRFPVEEPSDQILFEISVNSASGLPIMDKSISSTDAFVEARFGEQTWKTEVVTSLNPIWENERWTFEATQAQIGENSLELRVMDHDTYTANDAIGRVRLDLTILLRRMTVDRSDQRLFPMQLPIYDTLMGIRGELSFTIKVSNGDLGMRASTSVLAGSSIPETHELVEVFGVCEEIRIEKDPEYAWLDKIRTPRATNEARLSTIRKAINSGFLSLIEEAGKQGATHILNYRERVDVEGSNTEQLCVRVHGTAVRLETKRITQKRIIDFRSRGAYFPLLSTQTLPIPIAGCAGLVVARSVCLLDGDDEAQSNRKKKWASLRYDLFRQAREQKCDLVIGYQENVAINSGVMILSCMGTAVRIGTPEDALPKRPDRIEFELKTPSTNKNSSRGLSTNVPPPPTSDHRLPAIACTRFHLPHSPEEIPKTVKTINCANCRKHFCLEFLLSTARLPPNSALFGQKHYIQVTVRKRFRKADNGEEFAEELNKHLSSIDMELHAALHAEVKTVNSNGNAIFDLRSAVHLNEDTLVVVLTGVLVRLLPLQKEELASPSIVSVLSFPGLQKYGDARRFSWGSVRDAIRGRPIQAPSIQFRFMTLRPTLSELVAMSEDNAKPRRRLASFVEKVRRRQHEKDHLSQIAFERELCVGIGMIENCGVTNVSAVAGLHPANPGHSQIFGRDHSLAPHTFAQWSEVFIREEMSSLTDAPSVDRFVSAAVEEALTVGRAICHSCAGSGLTNFEISSFHLNVGRDATQALFLVSCDFAYDPN
ncbi:unnamed protein product, partial [Mesorhabditis belari]|uniref:C2 domain-containing protein n=1 Tax=Mesorhabditis belari TaxID=2138241 RepID=A0AAF3FU31_9BILA